jgi:ribose transport system ATP-binding protein
MVPTASVAENAMLGSFPVRGAFALVDDSALDALASDRLEKSGVAPRGLRLPIESLSGGNQQKVVLARMFGEVREADGPCLVVVAEPTRGIDASSSIGVHARLEALAADGHAVVLVTSDFRELRRLASRIVVLWKRRFAHEFGADADAARIESAMATGGEGGGPV